MRILLVEDEEHIRSTLKFNLELESYEVIEAVNGTKAIELFESQHFDLIILDIMLQGMDGYDVCEKVKLKNADIPIIMLSAKDTTKDKVKGLKLGADDYLTKPFDLEELLLRVQKLLERSQVKLKNDYQTFEFGSNKIFFKTFEATTSNGTIKLTNKETYLLKMLIEHKNEVVSRQNILQTVWDYDVYPSTRTIDNFVLAFRKYFEDDPKNPQYFKSIRGVGYMFSI